MTFLRYPIFLDLSLFYDPSWFDHGAHKGNHLCLSKPCKTSDFDKHIDHGHRGRCRGDSWTKKMVKVLIFTLFLLCTCIGQSQAKEGMQTIYRNVWYPSYRHQPLHYCSSNGKTCGMPIAEHYCKILGYQGADQEIIDHHAGLTNVIASNVQCKGWECDGFKKIRCYTNLAHTPTPLYYDRCRQFALPRYAHYRVDWCYQNGQGCGERAAHSFCRRMGYLRTKGFEKETHVAATKALGNQKLCFGKSCEGFRYINCYR